MKLILGLASAGPAREIASAHLNPPNPQPSISGRNAECAPQAAVDMCVIDPEDLDPITEDFMGLQDHNRITIRSPTSF